MDLREEVDKVFSDRISKLVQRQKNKGNIQSRHDSIQILKSMRNQVRAIFETFEILCNPELVEGLKNALQDFKDGNYEVLTKDDALLEDFGMSVDINDKLDKLIDDMADNIRKTDGMECPSCGRIQGKPSYGFKKYYCNHTTECVDLKYANIKNKLFKQAMIKSGLNDALCDNSNGSVQE